uniref:Uncharacterized protein n=2 Tax=Avena sativa TaxID=4498 RepID=A0ACD5YXU6_AVESA
MATATAPQPDLPDEMLEEIFLRLPTAADLARVSMACSSFRGVITDHSFLRRFRTLHPPPLLGIISTASFFPAQPPHLSAAAARTLANADFSCSFLPTRERWERHDFRDGRALMAGVPEGCSVSINDYDPRFLDMVLAVCDPLHRRYVLLPAIPDDLTAMVDQPDILDVVRFLSPSGEDVEHTSFTILCLVECRTKLILFIFSSGVGQWQAITFDGWGALIAGSVYCRLCYRYCVRGCFYWPIPEMNKMLLFDTRTMEFSSVDLPPGPRTRRLVFVEAAEGRLGMFTLPDDESDFPHVLRYAVLRNDGEGPSWWQRKATISVPLGSHYKAMGVAGGYLLLQVIPEGFYSIPKPERPDLDCFTVNLHTLELDWFCGIRHTILLPDLYAGFPPSLSLPTI